MQQPTQGDLYLSAHFDDVCFSIGHLAAWRGRGRLLTLFSRSAFLSNPDTPGLGPSGGIQDHLYIDRVSKLRMSEDAKFCETSGLTQAIGGLHEAPLRGRRPFMNSMPLSKVDAGLLGDRIMNDIRGRFAQSDQSKARPHLFCPMGIGDHIDHLVLVRTVLRNLGEIERFFGVCFYEDLYYASFPAVRDAGVKRFIAWSGTGNWRNHRHRLADQECAGKLDLIRLYASQFRTPPRSLNGYFLNDDRRGPYESLWFTSEGQ